MKIKIKHKGQKLPHCWKECKISHNDWQELESGKVIDVLSVHKLIENLVEVKASPKQGVK